MVKAECLVVPFRKRDMRLTREFELAFDQLGQIDIAEEDFIDAARLRASYGLKLPDALHLACAQRHGCAALWTNDNRLYEASRGMAVSLLG